MTPEKLLLEAALPKGERLLILEAGTGEIADHFKEKFSFIFNQNIEFQNHAASQKLLVGQSHIQNYLGDLPEFKISENPKPFDAVIYRLGKGTAQVNAALMQSFKHLKLGGHFWVAGHNQEGIKSFAKRAEELYRNIHIVKIKSSCRLLHFEKTTMDSEYSLEDSDYFVYREHSFFHDKVGTLRYFTKPGIFSYRQTDLGTLLLISHLPNCSEKTVLDMGCGSGIISIAASKLNAKYILAVDSNAIATKCTEKNFSHYSVPGKVKCNHWTEGIEDEFDFIFCNPPFHQGHETDYTLPAKILGYLAPRLKSSGELYLVANGFLDYSKPASEYFSKTQCLLSEKGYRIYRFAK